MTSSCHFLITRTEKKCYPLAEVALVSLVTHLHICIKMYRKESNEEVLDVPFAAPPPARTTVEKQGSLSQTRPAHYVQAGTRKCSTAHFPGGGGDLS